MPSFFDELQGTKPKVPDLPSLSLPREQQKALAANLAAVPGAEKIATKVDLFNQQQVDQMLSHVIPNYQAITGNIGKNIQALTAGQIPSDVQAQIQQSTAAQALAGGYSGSQAGADLTARDLGLTSLQLTQQGLASAQSWLQTANNLYAPGRFNVSSMFVTPSQQASFDVEERNAQFQRQWMQNQIAAQPAMWAQDLKEAFEATLAVYSGTPHQTAGTLPVGNANLGNSNFSGGSDFNAPYSPGAGEGGAGFDSSQTAFSDYAAGGGMDMGDGGGGGGGLGGMGGFAGLV